jgi:hypothetical protein
MSKFDSWNLARTGPDDVTSPGDHDFLVLLDAEAEVSLRIVRRMFYKMLVGAIPDEVEPWEIIPLPVLPGR